MTEQEIVELSEWIALRHEERPTFDWSVVDGEAVSIGGWWRCSHMRAELVVPRSILEPEITMRLYCALVLKHGFIETGVMLAEEITDEVGKQWDTESTMKTIARAYKKAVESKP